MELLAEFKPFLLGYKNIQFAEDNGILIAVAYPTKTHHSNKLKMYFINTNNGNLISEKEIYDNFSTSEIFALDNLFILYGEGWINAFDAKGNLKWDRTFDKPISVFEDNESKLIYIVSKSKIFCLKKKNGRTKWIKKISDFYELNIDKMLKSVVKITVVPMGIYRLFDGSEIGVVVGQMKGTIGESNLKHQIILLRLDKKGKFLGTVDLAVKSVVFKLISENGTFKIITDDQVNTYSK
ncbi:MAG: PQQ-like beta-propeller repeat protein [Candidatus Cloacimonetes bacterium]|nr:PQQ-like beta-propeller repeat protein [Candidatus Cloacimonadota bacterium]